MPQADVTFAEYLKADGYSELASDLLVQGKYGEDAISSAALTPLRVRIDAAAEAARQLALLAAPLAVDQHLIAGLWPNIKGRTIRLTGSTLGYDTPRLCLVTGVRLVTDKNQTVVDVVRVMQ
jgi:hypothetical protein